MAKNAKKRNLESEWSEPENARSDEQKSFEANERLLECVRCDNGCGVFRVLEECAGDWLGGPECRSDDPELNPALAALLSPFGSSALDGFDDFFGDLRKWSFGRWSPAHWAVAQKSDWALEWALGGKEQGGRYAEGDTWRLILQAEEASEGEYSKTCRSPLALCAQMGDPVWLRKVLELCEAAGANMECLAKSDRHAAPSALGMALFEFADKARQSVDLAALESQKKCVEILSSLGFDPDSSYAPAGKLCVALALSDPSNKGNSKMAQAALLAAECGSGSADGQKTTPYASAGAALDWEWARALKICGLAQSPRDCFALGASRTLVRELAKNNSYDSVYWAKDRRKIAKLAEEIRSSFAECGVDPQSSPMGGQERECVLWMGSQARGEAAVGIEQFRERVEMEIFASQATSPSKQTARL